jgi:hypothetical protein
MATWELTTEWKKSATEQQFWYKDDKVIIRNEGFRWGTFTVESDVRPVSDVELRNEDDCYELGSIENGNNWELVDLTDGCWAETEKGRNCTDEDLAAFEEAWEENWYEGVEELGWSHNDTEYFFNGPLKLTNCDTGVEYSGSVDPATIVTTIELPLEEVALDIAEVVNESTKWPFAPAPVIEETEMTDWFPVSINPVRRGFYEVLTKESINWPFPNKAEWTGKKWVFLDHTVESWRGLANEPK